MATYAFTRTREQMRDMILRKLGVKEAGQTPSSEDAEIVYEAMALRLRSLHRMGIQWYQVAPGESSVAITAGVASVSLSAITDLLFPVSVMLTVGTDQQEVEIIDHARYQAIPTKTERGEPQFVYITRSTAYMWPVPQSNGTLKLTYEAISADLETGVAPDIPVECMMPFATLVAFDLMTDFDVTQTRQAALTMQVEPSMKTIRALTVERASTGTVAPEWY